LGVLHAERARLLGLAAAFDLAGRGAPVVFLDDVLAQREVARQGDHGVTPQAGPAVDDGDVLHGLQGLEADLHAPLNGDQAVPRLALEVLGDHVAVGQVLAEGQGLLEGLRAEVKLRRAGGRQCGGFGLGECVHGQCFQAVAGS
jgi:hypothetical protein